MDDSPAPPNPDKENNNTVTNSTQQPDSNKEETNNDKVVFRVQIKTSGKRIETSNKVFNGLTIYEYQQGGLYKYATGYFVNDLSSANKHRLELKKQGFDDAFVIAFLNGERINLEKAIKLAEK